MSRSASLTNCLDTIDAHLLIETPGIIIEPPGALGVIRTNNHPFQPAPVPGPDTWQSLPINVFQAIRSVATRVNLGWL